MRLHYSILFAASMLVTSCASDAEKPKLAQAAPDTNVVSPAALTTNAPAKSVIRIDPATIATSPGLQEVIQLCRANVEESVVLAYIERSPIAYNPSVEEILYLNDIGISPQVVAALLNHGRELETQAAENAARTLPPATPVLENPGTAPTTATNPIAVGAPNIIPGTITESSSVQYVQSAPPVVPETQVITTTETIVPQQQVTLNYFYSSLSPYGTWMQVDDYGWCWQPSVVNSYSTWQPYGDRGRWLYTDCGWYWQSDYSWGWAPFHYGRWFRHERSGWMWRPDTEWGSAWVSWRRSPEYCGWAPLPPEAYYNRVHGLGYHGRYVGIGFDFGLSFESYTFIPLGHFYDRNPYAHFVSRDHMRPHFGQTTVENNYHRGPGDRVINEGIGRDRISASTRSEIRQVSVRDMPQGQAHAIRPDRTGREGKNDVIYRPNPQQPPAAMPSVTAKRIENNRPPVSISAPGTSRSVFSPRLAEFQTSPPKPTISRSPTAPSLTTPRAMDNPSIGRRETPASSPAPIIAPMPKAVENRRQFSERAPVTSPAMAPANANATPATSPKPIERRADPSPRMPVSNGRAPEWPARANSPTPSPAGTPTLSAPMPTVRSQSAPNYSKPPDPIRSMDTFNPTRTPMTPPVASPAQGMRFNAASSPVPMNQNVSAPAMRRMESAPVRQIQQAPARFSPPPVSPASSPRAPSPSVGPSPRPAMAPASSSPGRANQTNDKRP